MNYQETTNWMFSQLPMYQSKGKTAYKKDLTNILKFSEYLNNPQHIFKSVHVAGTNGKGSTSHMIASILQEAGYNVGLYTSPHLKDFRERIKINGNCISKQYVIQFIKQNKVFFEKNRLSFFEMTVGMAFDYFAKKRVDIAVVEVGLGGRLDSTNIIVPEVSVITNIGFDHMQFLGDTLPAIAKEKAGIIKKHVPVVISETQYETKDIFIQIAKNHNSNITFADQVNFPDYTSDLKGNYQKHNIQAAVTAIHQLNSQKFQIKENHIIDGLSNVVKNTGLLGRWQQLQSTPNVICDTAHNKEGLSYVFKQLNDEDYKELHLVIGFVKDKNIDDLIPLFPKHAKYYFCAPQIPRALNENDLKEKFYKFMIEGKVFDSVKNAFINALQNANQKDLVFVGGSTFVVAEIL